jgi:hypothetical protein
MKILTVGAELFHADIQTDRQTDSKKLIAASNNSVSVPKFVPVADFKRK